MYRCIFLVACFVLSTSSLFSQVKPSYQLFAGDGKEISYKKLVKKLTASDIILFGELHNNPIVHWLQYEITNDLAASNDVILGFEMLEADNQDELDLYLTDSIDYDGLDSLARLWSNYKTDYAPLVDFAKENDLPVIATNIPRRFAQLVYQEGFEALDSLSEEEKSWMAPLPMAFDPDLPTYQEILEMMGDHGTPELVKAQASKDATMAYFIYDNYQPGSIFIHFNGAFHSNYYEGILWYLKLKDESLNYTTISSVSQDKLDTLEEEHIGKADYIIVVDTNMTKTY